MGILFPIFPAWGRLAPYDGIGGKGGAPFRLDCGEYGVLVGLAGKAGAVVDQVAGLCVKVDPVSGLWVGGVYETPFAGGTGGGRFRKICQAGQVLIGIQGNSTYFQGNNVVSSLGIDCAKLRVNKKSQFPEIKGWRDIGSRGDPNPSTISELQDLCYSPQKGPGPFDLDLEYAWSRIGIALEVRTGFYVDHIHILCGSLQKDKKGYQIQFKTNAKGRVPEGTPLKITWRASGSKPELTPPLQYSWELHDVTAAPGTPLTRRTDVQNPCSYAQPPCSSSWFDSSSGSQIIFQRLPPAEYQLRLKVRPTVPSEAQSESTMNFEIGENLLTAITVEPNTVRTGGLSTATITLEGPAPPGGKKVYLSSSNPQLVPVSDSLTIPNGARSATLTLKADPLMVGGQATIRASLKKPLTVAHSKISPMRAFSRGIPETDGQHVIGTQEKTERFDSTQEIQEDHPHALSDGTEGVAADPDMSAPTDDVSQNQEITERGITSFGKVQSSRALSSIITTKPNQTAVTTLPGVIQTPPPPQPVPIPYPPPSEGTLPPATTNIQKTPKIRIDLLAIPSEAKEAVLTVQNSTIRSQPLFVPKVPPLQK